MPAKNSKTESDGFSAQERAAMKQRATELRAEGKEGAKKADGLQAALDKIAEMAPEDRALAERVHVTVTSTAPELSPKTWYGMPTYANADGNVVVFFQDAGKFNYRYSTLGFQDAANLDDGELWPVAYALRKWSPRGREEGRRTGEGRDLPTVTASITAGMPACIAKQVTRPIRNREAAGHRAAASVTAMDITIHTTFLPHDDPDASLAFYRDTLGFEVRSDVGRARCAGSRSAPSASPARPSSWRRRPPTPGSPRTSAAPSSR